MSSVKPNFLPQNLPSGWADWPYLASQGLTVDMLNNICVKEAEVVGVRSTSAIDVRYNGTVYTHVPVWVHTEISRAKLAGSGDEAVSAAEYHSEGALMFPLQQGFVYNKYGENPPVDRTVLQQIVLVLVHTDPDTAVISVVAAVRVIIGPKGLDKFASGAYFDNKPAETYRPVIQVTIGVRDTEWYGDGDPIEYSLWDMISGHAVSIPHFDNFEPVLPFFNAEGVDADDAEKMTAIQGYLWGSLFQANDIPITIETVVSGDVMPPHGGVTVPSKIFRASAENANDCYNANGTTTPQELSCIPADCLFENVNVIWGPDNPYTEFPQEFDYQLTHEWTSPCFGGLLSIYQKYHKYYAFGAEYYNYSYNYEASYYSSRIVSGGDHRMYTDNRSVASCEITVKDIYGSEIYTYSRATSGTAEAQIDEVYYKDESWQDPPWGDGGTSSSSWSMTHGFGNSSSITLQTSGSSLNDGTYGGSYHDNWSGDIFCYQWQNLEHSLSDFFIDKTFIFNGWMAVSVSNVVTINYEDNYYIIPLPLTAGSFYTQVDIESGSLPHGSSAATLFDSIPGGFSSFVKNRVEAAIGKAIDSLQSQRYIIKASFEMFFVPYNLKIGKLRESQ